MVNKNLFTVLSLGFFLVNPINIICVADTSKAVSYQLEETGNPIGKTFTLYQCEGTAKKKLGVLTMSKAVVLKPMLMVPANIAKNIPGFSEIRMLANTVAVKKYDCEKTFVLGDVYIFPNLRGNGYGKMLVEKSCKKIMEDGVERIVLIAQPFEYTKKTQTILSDQPDYQEKVERLIKLYGSCGFKKIDDDQVFMVLSKV